MCLSIFDHRPRLDDFIVSMGAEARFILIDSKGRTIGVVSNYNRGTWWAWYSSHVMSWYFDDMNRLCVKVDSDKKFIEGE